MSFNTLYNTFCQVSDSEELFVCGDFDGHIGSKASCFEGVHGGLAFGGRNLEGEGVLEFADANNLFIGNSAKEFFHLPNFFY